MINLIYVTFIFLNKLGMFSSSKGRVPQSRAYNITPQLHTSTSGPAYNLPEITYKRSNQDMLQEKYKYAT